MVRDSEFRGPDLAWLDHGVVFLGTTPCFLVALIHKLLQRWEWEG